MYWGMEGPLETFWSLLQMNWRTTLSDVPTDGQTHSVAPKNCTRSQVVTAA